MNVLDAEHIEDAKWVIRRRTYNKKDKINNNDPPNTTQKTTKLEVNSCDTIYSRYVSCALNYISTFLLPVTTGVGTLSLKCDRY